MGTWSHGNFDNDAALDWVGDTTGQLIAEIQEAMASPDSMQADEWDGDIVPCRIELLCVMAENGMAPRWPDLQELQQWKQSYLREWDGSIDELDPDEDYRRDRRETLVATFDRMLKLAAASAEAER